VLGIPVRAFIDFRVAGPYFSDELKASTTVTASREMNSDADIDNWLARF
jgi:hypothetical protein